MFLYIKKQFYIEAHVHFMFHQDGRACVSSVSIATDWDNVTKRSSSRRIITLLSKRNCQSAYKPLCPRSHYADHGFLKVLNWAIVLLLSESPAWTKDSRWCLHHVTQLRLCQNKSPVHAVVLLKADYIQPQSQPKLVLSEITYNNCIYIHA